MEMNKEIRVYHLILALIVLISAENGWGQDTYKFDSQADRRISPSYRITERPIIIDTVIPIPDITYPLLSRNKRTEISIEQIGASKIRIIEKLEKLYPGYARLGIGNFASPLGEIYYNSVRNRRTSLGIHLNHNSSFGNIDGFAPSSFDNTTARLFGKFFLPQHKIESEVDYLNNGYHFYGIEDTTDAFSVDSLRNRVQGFRGGFKFSNFTRKDSAKLLYTLKTDYNYFHEFDPNERSLNAKNTNFGIGADFAYKQKKNVYSLDFEVRYNKYKFADGVGTIPLGLQQNDNNTLIHLKPVISTYGKKWKVIYGVDLNFDVLDEDNLFKVVPIIEGKYSLFNNILIPYAGIGGGVKQNTFQTLNRTNEFIISSIGLKNTREFKAYAGIKGTLSKKLSFNAQFHSTTFTNLPLFVNDTVWSDLYRFNVVYDRVAAIGGTGTISYQAAEKLKIDVVGTYNNYSATNEIHAWNLPVIDIKLRGSYNLFEKIYVKSDITLQGGRKSPEGLFTSDIGNEIFELGFLADANLHAEYRYNDRVSAFIQFNNIAAQKYFRWNRYQVQGFQVLGGITFGF